MEENISLSAQWNFLEKVTFRFVFAYLVFYNLPFPFALPFDFFPFTWWNFIGQKYGELLVKFVPWVGKNILQIGYEIKTMPTGSGDRTFDYVAVFCFFILAVFISFIWTLLDYKRTNYDYLYQWLRVYIRFSLAHSMIGYGAYKVIKSQFPDLFLSRLVEPFGDASPMGLVWTFMGHSEPYNIFTGSAEMLGGILMIAPQVTTLGALVCIGVMSNVFMLNLSYDIPVKLYSGHLLIMSMFLLLPDLKRLLYLFVLNNKVEAVNYKPLFKNQKLNLASKLLASLFIIVVCVSSLMDSYETKESFERSKGKTPLYGIWMVDEFEVDGEIKPPLLTDETRWRRVIFQYPGTMLLQTMSEKNRYFQVSVNVTEKTIEVKGEEQNGKFFYEPVDQENLSFQGNLNQKPTKIKFHRINENKFLLNSRGFHWINEYPFNR